MSKYYKAIEDEIDLLLLAQYLVKHWIKIALACAAGILCGVLIFFFTKEDVSIENQNAFIASYASEQLTPEKKAKMELAYGYHKLYEEKAEYIQESHLMTMDSNAVVNCVRTFYLDMGEKDRQIGNHILEGAYSEEVLKEISDKVWGGEKAQFVRELYTVSVSNLNEDAIEVSCVVRTESPETGKQILDILEANFNKISIEVSADNNKDEFLVLKDYWEVVSDKELADYQKQNKDLLKSYFSNFTKLEDEFEVSDYEYYRLAYLEGEYPVKSIYRQIDKNGNPKDLLQKVVISTFVFTFAVAGVYVVKFLFDKSVKSADELKRRYALWFLGEVSLLNQDAEKKTNDSVVSIEYMRALLRNMNKMGIVLVGKQDDSAVNAAQKDLVAKDGSIVSANYLSCAEESLGLIKESKQVVIIVHKNVTTYPELERELDICEINCVSVLGLMLIE